MKGTEVTVDTDTEFSFLPAQAAALGINNVAPMQRVSVPVSDGRVVSALMYTADTPAVTLLHGAGLNAHTWDTTVLSMGLPALALDLPGHGDSTWRNDANYSPVNLATDVILALEALTSEPQILVGHSLGGLTAAAVAARRPDLVSRLILVDIVPGIDASGGPAILRKFYSQLEFESRDALVDYAMSFGLGGDRASAERGVYFNSRVRSDGVVEWKHHFARLANEILPTQSSEGTLIKDDQGWADLAGVAAPITLVRGSTGFIDDPAVAEFARRVPTAEIITVDAGHNVQETQPTTLGAIIKSPNDDE